MSWKTLYKCPCGHIITNGVEKWDDEFFLQDLCDTCGQHKDNFVRLGVGKIVWKPTILNWFRFYWVDKDGNKIA